MSSTNLLGLDINSTDLNRKNGDDSLSEIMAGDQVLRALSLVIFSVQLTSVCKIFFNVSRAGGSFSFKSLSNES